jgi:hypothetical protein
MPGSAGVQRLERPEHADGDGFFCIKAVSNLRGESVKRWAYDYAARDDDTSAGEK